MSESKKLFEEGDLTLGQIIGDVWKKRLLVLKVTVVFLVLSIFVLFGSTKEYEARSILVPEVSQSSRSGLSGLSGLAGLAGINVDLGIGNSSAMNPMIIPDIAISKPFLLEIIHSPVKFSDLDSLVTPFEYFKEIYSPSPVEFALDYSIRLPRKIINSFRRTEVVPVSPSDTIRPRHQNIMKITKSEMGVMMELQERLEIMLDDKSGMINVSLEMPDPEAAASLADLIIESLKNKVTQYKTEKARNKFIFISEQLKIANERYTETQYALAHFADKNLNISSSKVEIQRKKLENDNSLAFELYKSLATQMEQAKIAVEEEVPVFMTLEPVVEPLKESWPDAKIVIVVGLFLGIIFGIAFVVLVLIVRHLRLNPLFS